MALTLPTHTNEAIDLYEKAANDDNDYAKVMLVLFAGRSADRLKEECDDLADTMEWLLKNANVGNAYCMYRGALCYLRGVAVPRD